MISEDLYNTTIKNLLAIKTYAATLYDEWQDVLIEELGTGLVKPSFWARSSKQKANVLSMELLESDIYINARKSGALKIPVSYLNNPDWKNCLRKKLKRRKNKLLIDKLSE
jgi:hypothetical protein